MKNSRGFTLIELVATLVLVGILTAVAAIGIAQGVKGYIFARENTSISQRAQLAMERMRREMILITGITAAGDSSIAFTNSAGGRSIGLVGNDVLMAADAGGVLDGDAPLIRNVTNFTLDYYKNDGIALWTTAEDIEDLFSIVVNLTVEHEDSDVEALTFTTTINPRNTGVGNSPTGNI